MRKRTPLLMMCALWLAATASAGGRRLFVAHTSDTHSCVEPVSLNCADTAQAGKGGFARRAALVAELRAAHPEGMLLLDCGDFSQGSPYYNLFRGEVEVRLMGQMGYDACAIGNHEFDGGLDNMARLMRMAPFPFVCCNYDFRGTPCEGLVRPYVVLERAGLRVGVFGVSPRLEGLVARANYGATRYRRPAAAAQPVIDRLRGEEHCDVVICLSHLGWLPDKDADPDFISRTTGIDVVLGGHSHTCFQRPERVRDKAGREVLVDHEGKNGRFVGTVEIEME